MKLTLYYAPIACSLVPLITLNESGAPFDVHTVLLAKGQQKTPEYLKLNPKGKVPALAIDGEVLTENVAILSWIAGQFPERHLLPTEPRAAARALSMMAFCASGIHPHLGRANAPLRFCDHPGSEDATRRLAVDEVLKAFAVCRAAQDRSVRVSGTERPRRTHERARECQKGPGAGSRDPGQGCLSVFSRWLACRPAACARLRRSLRARLVPAIAPVLW
jgi:glutathione S-transferase